MLTHAAPRATEYIELLTERLPERTLRHTISVANLMGDIAAAAGVDKDNAVTAGLLHDMFKATKGHDLLEAADRYGIPIGPLHQEKPMLLHGPVAAYEAREVLGVSDPGVFDAIYWHTTGREDFSPMGLALYFADFSEPYRPMPEASEARARLASDGFIPALLYVAEKKFEFIRTKYVIDPATEAFYTWLCGTYRT